jgi:His-Xaa-Ser system radical SAM maturase HxsC
MITAKGIIYNFKKSKLLRIVSKDSVYRFSDNCAVVLEKNNGIVMARNALTSNDNIRFCQSGVKYLDQEFLATLKPGDIVSVLTDGTVNVLWKYGEDDNLLFLTDYCNSHCIMCPQTKRVDIDHYYKDALHLLRLTKDTPRYLCISGGEPTFLKEEYLSVLKELKSKFPSVALQVLTNGKNFADFEFLKECVLNSPIDTLYAIPIYSGNSKLHDSIVGSKGSFNKTVTGILNLCKLKQNVEIRVVVTRQNYKDLCNIAYFIYWNMPFVFRVVFMCMETHGVAQDNLDDVWVEPMDYMDNLNEAVQFLRNRMLYVLIYNYPQCILPKSLRGYAQDSISSWKKTFLEECSGCSERDICSGVFATSVKKIKGIHKI